MNKSRKTTLIGDDTYTLDMMRPRLQRLLTAGLAGLIATVPQTIAMELVRRLLPIKPGRFPPRQVAEEFVALATSDQSPPHLNEPTWQAITAVSHFGYGAAAGSLYGLLPSQPRNPPLRGALFGLLVWAGSYGVLLPALGIKRPQADHPIRKNTQLVAAHLAWGITIAVLFERFRSADRKSVLSRTRQ